MLQFVLPVLDLCTPSVTTLVFRQGLCVLSEFCFLFGNEPEVIGAGSVQYACTMPLTVVIRNRAFGVMNFFERLLHRRKFGIVINPNFPIVLFSSTPRLLNALQHVVRLENHHGSEDWYHGFEDWCSAN